MLPALKPRSTRISCCEGTKQSNHRGTTVRNISKSTIFSVKRSNSNKRVDLYIRVDSRHHFFEIYMKCIYTTIISYLDNPPQNNKKTSPRHSAALSPRASDHLVSRWFPILLRRRRRKRRSETTLQQLMQS